MRRNRRLGVVCLIAVCALAPVGSGASNPDSPHNPDSSSTRFFVSPAGKDSWPGTARRPFATLTRAQQAVRERTAGMAADVVVELRAGVYELRAPLELSSAARDSGENTLFGQDDPDGACAANSACAGVVANAGLEPSYHHLLIGDGGS